MRISALAASMTGKAMKLTLSLFLIGLLVSLYWAALDFYGLYGDVAVAFVIGGYFVFLSRRDEDFSCKNLTYIGIILCSLFALAALYPIFGNYQIGSHVGNYPARLHVAPLSLIAYSVAALILDVIYGKPDFDKRRQGGNRRSSPRSGRVKQE